MNTEKNYVVITFDRHGQFDGLPYLATEEEAINDCLEFNIGHCGFDGESEQLTEEIGKVEDLLKKKQYKEAWELWVDLELIDECSRHMGWYELGKKEKNTMNKTEELGESLMPDYQPIDYRLRCHTKRTDLPADVLRDIGEAYAEIGRLREERDEARRRLCIEWTEHGPVRLNKEQIAMRYGWDCFKENTNV